jgi:hypothetical protein
MLRGLVLNVLLAFALAFAFAAALTIDVLRLAILRRGHVRGLVVGLCPLQPLLTRAARAVHLLLLRRINMKHVALPWGPQPARQSRYCGTTACATGPEMLQKDGLGQRAAAHLERSAHRPRSECAQQLGSWGLDWARCEECCMR